MRILILGDSLSLPRPRHGQPLAVTWPALLQAETPGTELWQRAHTRFTIKDVLRELGFFTDSLGEFDALIIQTGIVDCAPRPYPHVIAKIIDACVSLPTFRKIEHFTHRRLLWLYRRAWISPRSFGAAIEEVVQLAHHHNPRLKTIFIPIAPPIRGIANTLRGIDAAAVRYNAILDATIAALASRFYCTLADPFSKASDADITIDDGHHLSATGHRLVANAVIPLLPQESLGQSTASRLPKLQLP